MIPPRISFVTLAVGDLARSRAYYVDGLGWPVTFEADEVVMIRVGPSTMLSLWTREGFVGEVGSEPGAGLAPFTLAYNTTSDAEVDDVVGAMVAAGGTVVRPAGRREWGGYTAYVADPDSILWEVAHNPSDLGHELVARASD